MKFTVKAYKVKSEEKMLLIGIDEAGWHFAWKHGYSNNTIMPNAKSVAMLVNVEIEDSPMWEKEIERPSPVELD